MKDKSILVRSKFPNLEVTDSGGTATYINGIPEAPSAAPFLSTIALAGDTVYVSGQIPIDPSTNKMIELGVEAETEQIFNNIEAALKGVGLTLADVVKVSVYLTSFDEFAKFNEIYLKRMGQCRPAREAIEVGRLAMGATVEITATAYRDGGLTG
jgi:2-iminobutanoate/2-iminopropanoate deaminase